MRNFQISISDKLPKRKKLLMIMPLFTKPEPLKRPRLGQGRVYQPVDNLFGILTEMERFPPRYWKHPVIIDYFFMFNRKKKKETLHAKKPDLDNVIKAVNDCLTKVGIIYDDNQIVGMHAYKMYDVEDYMVLRIYEAG